MKLQMRQFAIVDEVDVGETVRAAVQVSPSTIAVGGNDFLQLWTRGEDHLLVSSEVCASGVGGDVTGIAVVAPADAGGDPAGAATVWASFADGHIGVYRGGEPARPRFMAHAGGATSLCVAPGVGGAGALVISGGYDFQVKAWPVAAALEPGRKKGAMEDAAIQLDCHDAVVNAVAVVSLGAASPPFILSGCTNGSLYMTDIVATPGDAGELRRTQSCEIGGSSASTSSGIESMCVVPFGTSAQAWTGRTDGSLVVFRIGYFVYSVGGDRGEPTSRTLATFARVHGASVSCIARAPSVSDQVSMWTGSADGSVAAWHVAGERIERLYEIDLSSGFVSSIVPSWDWCEAVFTREKAFMLVNRATRRHQLAVEQQYRSRIERMDRKIAELKAGRQQRIAALELELSGERMDAEALRREIAALREEQQRDEAEAEEEAATLYAVVAEKVAAVDADAQDRGGGGCCGCFVRRSARVAPAKKG